MRCYLSLPDATARPLGTLWDAAATNTNPVTTSTRELRLVVNEALRASLSLSTQTTYTKQWNLFFTFLKQHDLATVMPINPDHICLFLANLHQNGLKAVSMRTYLSSIAFQHKLIGLSDPCQNYKIQKLVQGFSHMNSNSQLLHPILKITLGQLLSSIPFLTKCVFTRTLIHALFLLSYHACLRASEATVTDTATHTLQLHNIKFFPNSTTPQSCFIHFHSFKHSDTKTADIVIQAAQAGSPCPVAALINYIQHRGSCPGPIFLDHNRKPLHRNSFSNYVKKCATLAGLNPTYYNTHSFRIGRATQMAMDNIPTETIRRTGRWKSDAYLKYIRPTLQILPP